MRCIHLRQFQTTWHFQLEIYKRVRLILAFVGVQFINSSFSSLQISILVANMKDGAMLSNGSKYAATDLNMKCGCQNYNRNFEHWTKFRITRKIVIYTLSMIKNIFFKNVPKWDYLLQSRILPTLIYIFANDFYLIAHFEKVLTMKYLSAPWWSHCVQLTIEKITVWSFKSNNTTTSENVKMIWFQTECKQIFHGKLPLKVILI